MGMGLVAPIDSVTSTNSGKSVIDIRPSYEFNPQLERRFLDLEIR